MTGQRQSRGHSHGSVRGWLFLEDNEVRDPVVY